MDPLVGISLMLEPDVLNAARPLFTSGEMEILEWSFDMGWGETPLPDECSSLLEQYSQANRLIGHGVTFSLLSGQWTDPQELWLLQLADEISRRNYRHISEHFGFMSAGSFHRGAPMPVPLTPNTLALGQSRMRDLAELCGVPIGLENLALAFGPQDVAEQGSFIDQLITPVDGFLLLDLHNIYCQTCNFQVDPMTLLQSYPLEKVREIHISGGSWDQSIRRDTHDQDVPEEVFELLKLALPLCPQTEVIILERLGNTITNEAQAESYRRDFFRIKSMIREHSYACS